MIDDILPLLRCPLCGGALSREGGSLVCPQGHCYDVARNGTVHFAPGRRERVYTRAFFEQRALAFASGLYAPVLEAIGRALSRFAPGERPVLVDAGCGEGYYLRGVCPGRAMTRVGFDLSKDAIRMAARGGGDATFFVADLARIPLADGCADAVLDVFAPANYREFGRILKPGGVVVKLSPRAGYLRELRQLAGGRVPREMDGERVSRYEDAHMRVICREEIAYSQPVEPQTARALCHGSPLLSAVDADALDVSGVTRLTIEETLCVGTLS